MKDKNNAWRKVMSLHQEVDRKAKTLEQRHIQRLQCRKGCFQCCVDDLTIFEVEADLITRFHNDVLQQEPHQPGACAFLDQEGGCRIYQNRPYVCRTQGLPLRWVEEDGDDWLEYRDICPLNEQGEPLENLPEDACWTLGETESQLASLQAQQSGGSLPRVSLRSLFKRDPQQL